MLKMIPAMIGPELLHSLARMGHGDELLVVDRNYPAYAAGAPVHRLDGVGVVTALDAVLSLFPVDDFIAEPLLRMGPVDDATVVTPVQQAVHDLVERVEGRAVGLGVLDRFAFYERARRAAAVVATSEDQPYGCFVLVKGVVR